MLVKQFYCDDDLSLIPGKKDFVSLGKNKHEHKCLVLCHLKEFFVEFKPPTPNVNIGFSKFCILRLKWYILVGSSESHSVSVCTIHQNTTLLVTAVKLDVDADDLLDLIVYDRTSRECMMHCCSNCPAMDPLNAFLLKNFDLDKDNIEDGESQKVITFKQRSKTN